MDELRQSRNKPIIIIVFAEQRGDRCPRFSSGTSTNTFSAPINSNFVYKIVSIQPLLTFPSIAMYELSWADFIWQKVTLEDDDVKWVEEMEMLFCSFYALHAIIWFSAKLVVSMLSSYKPTNHFLFGRKWGSVLRINKTTPLAQPPTTSISSHSTSHSSHYYDNVDAGGWTALRKLWFLANWMGRKQFISVFLVSGVEG